MKHGPDFAFLVWISLNAAADREAKGIRQPVLLLTYQRQQTLADATLSP